MHARTALLATLITSMVMFGGDQTGHALDVEDMTLSPAVRQVIKKYGAIPTPGSEARTSAHKPSDCRLATWCDVVDVKLVLPGGFTHDFAIRLIVRWSLEANDYDVYLYDDPNKATPVDTSADFNATAGPVEVVGLLNPPAGTYYLVIYNYSAVNQPYEVKGEFLEEEKLPDLPVYQRRKPQTQTSAPATAGTSAPRTSRPEATLLPPELSASPRAVESYGSDGQPSEEELQALKTANVDEPFSLNPVTLSALIVLIIGASVAVFVFFTKRRQKET